MRIIITYLGDRDAVRAVEEDGRVVVHVRDPDNNGDVPSTARRLVGARYLQTDRKEMRRERRLKRFDGRPGWPVITWRMTDEMSWWSRSSGDCNLSSLPVSENTLGLLELAMANPISPAVSSPTSGSSLGRVL